MQMNGRFDVNLSLHDQFLTHAWLILALRVSNLTAIERWQGRVVHLIQGPCLRRAVCAVGRAAKPWPARCRRFTTPVACGDSPWMLAQRGDCANSLRSNMRSRGRKRPDPATLRSTAAQRRVVSGPAMASPGDGSYVLELNTGSSRGMYGAQRAQLLTRHIDDKARRTRLCDGPAHLAKKRR